MCRCLAKNPDERWQTAGELLHELTRIAEVSNVTRNRTREGMRWAVAILITAVTGFVAWLVMEGFQRPPALPPPSQIRAIAVLPLDDLSGEPDQEYFADGMTEQLIADLATIGGLRVTSRTSVMHYKRASKPVPTIAKELSVDALIEGAIVRANGKVRITAKLIEGASGKVLWGQSFERDLHDVLVLQREVARAITSKVDVTLTPQEQARLETARIVEPEVHRHVLLGQHHMAKASEEGLHKAVEYFNLAIMRDPANAMAFAGLAEAHVGLSGFHVPPRESMPKAKRAAETALALDESLASAHAVLGFIHLVYDWDGPAAERALLRALELNPTLATARLHRAAHLTTQARHDEAVKEIWKAVEFDPASIRTNAIATSLLLFTQRYDEAIELARRGLEFEPNSAFALAFQAVAYVHQGRYAEAVANVKKAEQTGSERDHPVARGRRPGRRRSEGRGETGHPTVWRTSPASSISARTKWARHTSASATATLPTDGFARGSRNEPIAWHGSASNPGSSRFAPTRATQACCARSDWIHERSSALRRRPRIPPHRSL